MKAEGDSKSSASLLPPLLAGAFTGHPQCLSIMDCSPETLRPLRVLKGIQDQRSVPRGVAPDRKLLEAELRELHRQRRDCVALHGAAAPVSDLDRQIRNAAAALRPILVETNPSAHQIVLALPQCPGNALVVVIEEAVCQMLLLPSPGDSVRHMATTIARGFRGEPVYPAWRCHSSTITTVHPRVSIVISATRETVAALMSCPLLQEVGLAESIIPIDDAHTPIADLNSLINFLPGIIEERYVGVAGVPDSSDASGDPPNPNGAVSRLKRVEDAFARWGGLIGRAIPTCAVAQAINSSEALRSELHGLHRQKSMHAEEEVMAQKLKSKGTWSLRELARCYPTSKQSKTYLEPILARLIARGLVGAAPNGRFYLVPSEGDTSSALTVLTC